MNDLYFVALFASIFFLTILSTKVIILFLEKNNIKSVANERSSHFIPVGNGGGFGFFFITITSLLFLLSIQSLEVNNINYFLFASFGIGITGYLDDLIDIHQLPRFVIQILASVVVILFFSKFPEIYLLNFSLFGHYLLLVFGIFFLVWLTNLYNFMDGIDGLATIQGLFILLCYLVLVFPYEIELSIVSDEKLVFLYSIIILGAGLSAFLIFNFPNSSIFMGDVGSSFLGFFLGSLGIFASANGWIYFWTLTIIWSMFLVDATVTLLVRFMRGDKWYDAHRTHAYQKICEIYMRKINKKFPEKSDARTKTHRFVCSIYGVVNLLWVLPLSILSIRYPTYGFLIAFLCFSPIVIGSLYFEAGKSD